jgi:hypothetical protein
MLKHQEFRSLPVGFQVIIMKGLGFLDGGYDRFTDFGLDIALLARSLDKNQARVELPDYQPSELIRRAIAASVDTTEIPLPKKKVRLSLFKKQIIEPPVNKREQLVAEMEKMLSAARPPEVIETEDKKRERLTYWRKWTAYHYVYGGISTKSTDWDTITRFNEYLSMIPEDQEAKLWRDFLEAIFVIDKSGIRVFDEKFDNSYSDNLASLIVNNDGKDESLPFVKLDELAKPLIELADKLKLMAESSDVEPKKGEEAELTIPELLKIFLINGRALDMIKGKSPNRSLAGIEGYKRQAANDFIEKAIGALNAIENKGVKFINVGGDKIPIGQIRARVEKDLKGLSG